LGEVLKARGYATAIFGKWHIGDQPETRPPARGFDESCGLMYSNDMWEFHPENPEYWGRFPLKYWENGAVTIPRVTREHQPMLTTWYTERATDFIRRHRHDPLFLYVPQSMPHVPLFVSEKFKGKSGAGLYGDVMMEIDWSVGEVMKALKAAGIEDNTLVVFTSDNGPWMCFGNHAGSAFPLREGKGSMWEGGHRVPCIMHWPAQAAKGLVTDKMASTIDLLPTIATVTGSDLPKAKIDGVDILPVIQGKDETPRNEFWCYYGGELHAVKKGDWKLYFPREYRSYNQHPAGKDGYPGWTKQMPAGLELYNLKDDIGETTNVIGDHPEVLTELNKIADQARFELGDRLNKVEGAELRPLGQLN